MPALFPSPVLLLHPALLFLQLLIALFLGLDQIIIGDVGFLHQCVQFNIHRQVIPVLRVLNNEHHQKRNNRGAGINDQLPSIRKFQQGTANSP